MAGAMAGTAILAARTSMLSLGTVTLTINNTCNLACPHCYLQYGSDTGVISDDVLSRVLSSRFDQICIVGKEPLANRRSASIVSEIVESATERGRSVSLVTNGLNAHLLSSEIVRRLSWIDISLDGGRETYEAYRKGSWEKLVRSVDWLKSAGATDIRLLQTISAETIGSVPDMVEVHALLGASLTLFSPFQATRSDGVQSVSVVGPGALVEALEPAGPREGFYLSFDSEFASSEGNGEAAFAAASTLFGDRFLPVLSDPLDRGLIRVTYDGLVLTPFESVHTAGYAGIGRPLGERSVDAWYNDLRGTPAQLQPH